MVDKQVVLWIAVPVDNFDSVKRNWSLTWTWVHIQSHEFEYAADLYNCSRIIILCKQRDSSFRRENARTGKGS